MNLQKRLALKRNLVTCKIGIEGSDLPSRHYIDPRYENNVQFNTEHVFSLLLPAVTSVSLQPSEHDEFCWVDLHQARNIVWSWSNREALEMVISADRQG